MVLTLVLCSFLLIEWNNESLYLSDVLQEQQDVKPHWLQNESDNARQSDIHRNIQR